jgi:CheY-like chemotaxis protein
VWIISTEDNCLRGLKQGAVDAIPKPFRDQRALEAFFDRLHESLEPDAKTVLVVAAEESQRATLGGLLQGDNVQVVAVDYASNAADLTQRMDLDLAVFVLRPGDEQEFEAARLFRSDSRAERIPALLYMPEPLSAAEESDVKAFVQATFTKEVRSTERLFDETALFLHRRIRDLPAAQQEIIGQLHEPERSLAGKKVLLVDDDIRNIFAMTSLLERHNMQVISAETGAQALSMLSENPDVDIVLMDIMMPTMDGYDTIRAARQISEFHFLPIIALTAKAMKGDRDRCIEAGASDYISKPVDPDHLLSTLRLWLHK